MTRIQFFILNGLAGVLALLLGLKVALALDIGARQGKLLQAQQAIGQAQRAEPVMRELALRLAQAALQEPQLADLLKQHNIRVTPTQPQIVNP
jgi:hypothetical protein